MPKLQRAALVITLALLSPSPSFAQSGKAESIPANDRALKIVDASSLQFQLPLTLAQDGDRFVLKDVRVIMQDTRYIEGWLSRKETSIDGRIVSRFGQLLRAPTKDFEDLTLLQQIRSNCSVIGMRDKSQIATILQSDACRFTLYGVLQDRGYEELIRAPDRNVLITQPIRLNTYSFSKLRLAKPTEIDPPAITVTADELKANAHQYIGQWVLMKNVVVRSFPGGLTVPLDDKNFVSLDDISNNQASEQILKHIEDRCYKDAEYKDIYKPEECTFSVKFRVFYIPEGFGGLGGGDVQAPNVLFVEPRK